MLLCLEEQGGFFAYVYELGLLLLFSYPHTLSFLSRKGGCVRISDPVQKKDVLE